jgi:hypothetical protein
MTIEWIRGVSVAVVAVGAIIALSCATTVSNRTGDSLDTTQYPPDIRDAYKVFAVRCSRCHTLARPLNARIRDPQQWVRYVQRMRLNPASGINAKNGEIILRFLLYYMHQREKERAGESGDMEVSPEASAGEVPLAAAEDARVTTGASTGDYHDAQDAHDVTAPEHEAPAAEASR